MSCFKVITVLSRIQMAPNIMSQFRGQCEAFNINGTIIFDWFKVKDYYYTFQSLFVYVFVYMLFCIPFYNFSFTWRFHKIKVKSHKFCCMVLKGRSRVRVLYCAYVYRDTGPLFLLSSIKDLWLSLLILATWLSHY